MVRMNNKYLLFLLLYFFFISTIFSQSSTKNEVWFNSSLTSEMFNVSATEIGSLKNRNRIGASLGMELRKQLNESLSIDFGLQIKSFRKSFIFNIIEVFIEDINLHIPLLLNYNLKLTKKHFANFKMGINGTLQMNQSAEFSVNQYSIEVAKKSGFFPNLKFGFGYKFESKRSFEVNLLYNMGFFQRNNEIIEHLPSETIVKSSTNGSFIELELQYKLR